MTNADFLVLVERTTKHLYELSASKGKEYTDGSADRLENFKSEAKNCGITELQIWSVYASKHYRSIQSYIRHGGKVFSNEPIEGRIDDLLLYLLLLKGLIVDSKVDEPANLIDYNISLPGNKIKTCRLTPDEINYYNTYGSLEREALVRNHMN